MKYHGCRAANAHQVVFPDVGKRERSLEKSTVSFGEEAAGDGLVQIPTPPRRLRDNLEALLPVVQDILELPQDFRRDEVDLCQLAGEL